MESQLFNGLFKSLHYADEARSGDDLALYSLARSMAKNVNKKQTAQLLKAFPDLFGQRAGKLTVKRAKDDGKKIPIAGASTTQRRNKALHQMGRYGTEVQAKAAAGQLMTPDAITYQSALFPQPKDYGVKVEVLSATPAKLDVGVGNPMYRWTLDVDLDVTGEAGRVASWLRSFKEKVRAQL